jgi:hypothetical protein
MQKLLLISLCIFSAQLPETAPIVKAANDLAEVGVHEDAKVKKTMAANLGTIWSVWSPPPPRPSKLITQRIEVPYRRRQNPGVRVPDAGPRLGDDFVTPFRNPLEAKSAGNTNSRFLPADPLLLNLSNASVPPLWSSSGDDIQSLAREGSSELLEDPAEVLNSIESLAAKTEELSGPEAYRFRKKLATASPVPEPAAMIPLAGGLIFIVGRRRTKKIISDEFAVTPFGEPVSGTGVMRPRTCDLQFAG